MLNSSKRFIYLDFDVQVDRCQRRTASMTTRNGMVYIRAPYLMSEREILNFIVQKQDWLRKQLSSPKRRVNFEMRDGETVWILGQPHVLKLVNSARGAVEVNDREVIIYGSSLASRNKAWRRYCEDLADIYIDRFRRQLYCEVGDYQLEYRFFKARWGCCFGQRRLIRMNLWCVCLDEEAFRYVFCHELAHLKVGNHQKEFYERLAQIWPDYKKGLKLSKQYQIA